MKSMNRSAVLMIAAALGAGCVRETPPTVEYFRAHREERVAQLQRCTNEAASSKSHPVCVNAREAERLESVGRLRDLPPAGLAPLRATPEDEAQAGKRQD